MSDEMFAVDGVTDDTKSNRKVTRYGRIITVVGLVYIIPTKKETLTLTVDRFVFKICVRECARERQGQSENVCTFLVAARDIQLTPFFDAGRRNGQRNEK